MSIDLTGSENSTLRLAHAMHALSYCNYDVARHSRSALRGERREAGHWNALARMGATFAEAGMGHALESIGALGLHQTEPQLSTVQSAMTTSLLGDAVAYSGGIECV